MSDQIFGLGMDHKLVPAHPDEVRINCPFCPNKPKGPDTKFHCYVNAKKGRFQCFKCGEKGSTGRLKGNFTLVGALAPEKFTQLRGRLEGLFRTKKGVEYDLDAVSWPLTEIGTPIAYKYMTEVRKFTDEEIERYSLRVGRTYYDEALGKQEGKWAGRVLFPFFENGKVVYLVARAYAGKEPKYRNSESGKDLVVYGIDKVQSECILCEGIISAIGAERETGIPAISLLGKTGTKWQLSKIRNHAQKIWVCLDGDVEDKEVKALYRSLLRLGVDTWRIDLPPGTDPDELRSDFMLYFNKARRVRL